MRRYFSVLSSLRKPYWSSDRVRQTFINYYANLGCSIVPSSSVIPDESDKSLQFVNAGMNQFKPIFLASPNMPSSLKGLALAANSQKCIRVGGKHCDLQSVGVDSTHHTFFEMLGNWAFNGRLSKFEACRQAWILLTEIYGFNADDFYVTYFAGDKRLGLSADLETREAWLKLGLKSDQVVAASSIDNFWEMGFAGPCGPCTELLYGRGDQVRPADCLELWNIVFIQYDRVKENFLRPLPSMHVDTGMGLERLCRLLQKVPSNYDTDLFTPLIELIRSNDTYDVDNEQNKSVERLVADHARACSVLIAEGVRPAGKDAGHVLRRLLRSAVHKYLSILRCKPGILTSLAPVVAETLRSAYPEVYNELDQIQRVMSTEEKSFLHTLERVTAKCRQILLDKKGVLNSGDFFQLHATYGLPKEVIKQILVEMGGEFDEQSFEQQRLEHIEKSRPASQNALRSVKF